MGVNHNFKVPVIKLWEGGQFHCRAMSYLPVRVATPFLREHGHGEHYNNPTTLTSRLLPKLSPRRTDSCRMPLHRADLNSSDIVSNVRKILTASGQPKVSAILVQAYENDVTLHVTADSSSGDRSTAGGGQTQRLGPDILGGAVHPDNSQEENQKNNAVYMVGSYTKVISNFTMSELMKQTNPKTERNKLVYDLVRQLGHQADAGGIEIDCLKGNPQIGELMCNVNSFPPMNEYCFAPDGTFLWTIE